LLFTHDISHAWAARAGWRRARVCANAAATRLHATPQTPRQGEQRLKNSDFHLIRVPWGGRLQDVQGVGHAVGSVLEAFQHLPGGLARLFLTKIKITKIQTQEASQVRTGPHK